MLIALHKNARTTPAVRAEIAASDETARVLAQRYGITEQTVYKWKKRSVFGDRSHTAHRLQTVLTSAQESVVVHLRRTLLLPLDDLLAVTREFICPHVSRSGLDRCLRRHGAGNLNALKPQEPAVAHKAFKSYEPGYVHMDVKYLPQMQDESQRRYLFVAIDRATRWVFVALKANKTAASAQAFLKALHKACPIRIKKLLTDNGKEFTDRLFASREREPSGNHEFDQLCQELGIEHRLTKPRTPRTNGMVERFNGRIADVLKTHRFNSREDMEETLLRYVALYNHHLPQSALGSKTPMQAMKNWYQKHPNLFHKRPYDRPGCDTYAQSKSDAELHELYFVKQMLDCLVPGSVGIAIVPMSCAISPHPVREELMKHHTLDAVMSMPQELFYPVGTVTCIMVWVAGKPHAKTAKKTWFGYWREDGFVKTKHKGRIDLYGTWPAIRDRWVERYRNREVHAGESIMQAVSAADEWCAEAYMETDYSTLSQAHFEHVVKNYAMFRLFGREDDQQEVTDAEDQ